MAKRKKLNEEEKKRRRRLQKRISMRKSREKMSSGAIEERRKKDRERYQRKKEMGLTIGVHELSERDQRAVRKDWAIRSKRYRLKKKKEAEENKVPDSLPEENSTQPSPTPSRMPRVHTILKNRRILRAENKYLKSKMEALTLKLKNYRVRLHRAKKKQHIASTDTTRDAESSSVPLSKRMIDHESIKRSVKNFLEYDECSRLTAGKKETITRKKIKKQIRFLNDTLSNLHKEFVKSTGHNISYVTFCRYRPFWIINPTVKARDTCLCKIHENIKYMVWTLKKFNIIKESTPNDLAKSLCCENKLNEACLERKCEQCQNYEIEIKDFDNRQNISYERWTTKKVDIVSKGKPKCVTKTVKETVNTTKKKLVSLIKKELLPFMKHVSNMLHQFRAVKKVKAEISAGVALLHMDFSENYGCKYKEEIQSAHFGGSKPQITLHTSVLYFKTTNTTQPCSPENISFCTVSENLRHDPVLICAHLKPILEKIKELLPSLKTFHILSDGPSTQYRNKTMFRLMSTYLSTQLNVENIIWHYTESGHGKGAPDGVGGCVKRTADRAVALGRDVSNFEQLITILQDNCKGIKIIPINDENISCIENYVKEQKIIPFKGTFSIHQLTWNANTKNVIHARRLSCMTCSPDEVCEHYELGQIHVDDKQVFSAGSQVTAIPSTSSSKQPGIMSTRNQYLIPSDTDTDSADECLAFLKMRFSDQAKTAKLPESSTSTTRPSIQAIKSKRLSISDVYSSDELDLF